MGQENANEAYVKASLLLNFIEQTEWDNNTNTAAYTVVIVQDEEVYKELDGLTKKINVNNKKVKTVFTAKLTPDNESHLIYLPQAFCDRQSEVRKNSAQTLIVCNECEEMEEANINFYLNEQDQVRFTVNRDNFKRNGMTPSSVLLVYANNKDVAIEFIQNMETEFKIMKEAYEQKRAQLEKTDQELKKLNESLQQKEKKIRSFERDIEEKSAQTKEKAVAYERLNERYAKQEKRYNSIEQKYLTTQENLTSIRDSLQSLSTTLSDQSEHIDANNVILQDQKQQIEEQKETIVSSKEELIWKTKNLWIAIICLGIMLILLYLFYRENKAKKRSLDIIEKQNEEIKKSSQYKDKFISGLSHEIRTPLNAIIGYSALLSKQLKDEESKKFLSYITLSSKNLMGIINDILDLKKIESGKSVANAIHCELKPIVMDAFKSLEVLANEKQLNYVVEYDDALPRFVFVDAQKLSQTLLNLLNNAIKFTDEGTVKISVKQLSGTDKVSEIEFVVTDTGIGISENKMSQIFDSFTQEDETISKRFGGTGLGLALSQEFVGLLGGEITAKSELRKGSQFNFSVMMPISDHSEIVVEHNGTVKIEGLDQIKIVYADDIELNRTLLTKQLKSVSPNIQLKTVRNGLELLKVVEKEDVDLIITDVWMPGMDGIEAAARIREMNSEIKIIGVTATGMQSIEDLQMSKDMDAYLIKPYELNDLLIKLAKTCNLKYSIHNKEENKRQQEIDVPFKRLKEIAEDEADYLKMVNGLISEIKEVLNHLETNPLDAESAHKLVNKITYLNNKQLVSQAKELEGFARKGNEKKARDIRDKLKEATHQILNDFSI
ncbi:MAG: YfiR/HmsC family protein [Crocinitomicaceae bacterium]